MRLKLRPPHHWACKKSNSSVNYRAISPTSCWWHNKFPTTITKSPHFVKSYQISLSLFRSGPPVSAIPDNHIDPPPNWVGTTIGMLCRLSFLRNRSNRHYAIGTTTTHRLNGIVELLTNPPGALLPTMAWYQTFIPQTPTVQLHYAGRKCSVTNLFGFFY